MLAPREAAKVSNARQGSSYLRVRSITAAASLRARFRCGVHRYEASRAYSPASGTHGWKPWSRNVGRARTRDYGPRMTSWSATGV